MPDAPTLHRPPTSPITAFLRNAILLCLALLLAACTFLVVQLALVAQQFAQTAAAVSGDVRQVAKAAGEVSSDISQIREEVHELLDRAKKEARVEETQNMLETGRRVKAALKAEGTGLNDVHEDEIQELFEALARSGRRAITDGDDDDESVFWLSVKLMTRYGLLRGGLGSTEDFIDQVATESTFGNRYYLVDEAGKRTALNEWMRERLAEMRAKRAEAR